MTLSLASLANACTAQEETKLRHPQPKEIEPSAEDVRVNFQVLLIPGFKLPMPTLPALPALVHKGH